MDGEEGISKADFFLRDIPSVKTSNAPVEKKFNVKEELQFMTLNEGAQEKIMETLKYIHGPDFTLKEATSYEDTKTNFKKKYWVGQGSLVIKGAVDFSQVSAGPQDEENRLKQFALLRLESYGFHKNHCLEAMQHCEDNVEDSLYLLYNKYFNPDGLKEVSHDLSKDQLLEQRTDEASSLRSIYESVFQEKVQDTVWILTLKLDYLIKIFHNKPQLAPVKKVTVHKNKEKCKNFIRGKCKYGNKCRFLHEEPQPPPKDPDSHLTDYVFELEIRFAPNTNYPFEPPLIFLKTNAVLPPLVNLHICKRLYEQAKLLAEDGIPSVYTITEILLNSSEIEAHLKTPIDFMDPTDRLFYDPEKHFNKIKRPSHYKKGSTNRDNKKRLSWREITEHDERIVGKFKAMVKDKKYLEMLKGRRNLPAWGLMNDILNTVQKSQVVVVSGETGCGKSTQVPQYILDDWLLNYEDDRKHIEIVCTQPRRISAIGVAERVAEERVARIGQTIGYQIRLESKVSAFTRLTFCTTGILLRRLEGEPTLPTVTHILVDEVHERSEESDEESPSSLLTMSISLSFVVIFMVYFGASQLLSNEISKTIFSSFTFLRTMQNKYI